MKKIKLILAIGLTILKKNTNKLGFSLLEIVIFVSIVSIISISIFLVHNNDNSYSKDELLKLVKNDIRDLQNISLSKQEIIKFSLENSDDNFKQFKVLKYCKSDETKNYIVILPSQIIKPIDLICSLNESQFKISINKQGEILIIEN